jgi:hypothetical protein
MNFSRPCRQQGWAGWFAVRQPDTTLLLPDSNVACELPRSVLMNFRAGVDRKMKSEMCHAQRETANAHLFQPSWQEISELQMFLVTSAMVLKCRRVMGMISVRRRLRMLKRRDITRSCLGRGWPVNSWFNGLFTGTELHFLHVDTFLCWQW